MDVARARSVIRQAGRILLGVFLAFAGMGHLTFGRVAFRAQLPPWPPMDVDLVLVASGVVEIALGQSLLILVHRRVIVGLAVAVLLLAVFPENISQFATQTNSFGLDCDRGILLLFQPLLVLWALWCTGAGNALQERHRSRRHPLRDAR